jgi:hypothetical protein
MLTSKQGEHLAKLLRIFFALPYSTDLDGKDAEKLLRIVKGYDGPISKRKELFDIVSGAEGYSVKTLRKNLIAARVDLQEQRFCDTAEMEAIRSRDGSADAQGALLLGYIRRRIIEQMKARRLTVARSAILLKHWDTSRTHFVFRYWEEDFLGWIDELCRRDAAGELDWVIKPAGLHGRDRRREGLRLIRMHWKHNQIFTDHDIPSDAMKIEFDAKPVDWEQLHDFIYPPLRTIERSVEGGASRVDIEAA